MRLKSGTPVFHYCPRSDKNERFEIGIATRDMDEAAWRYGHSAQLILDGTFGVCSERLLLFIVMVVDEGWKGVPVSFLLFSAATGAKATHASYNRAILEKLLLAWKRHLGSKNATVFTPAIAITDTDTKERSALAGRVAIDMVTLVQVPRSPVLDEQQEVSITGTQRD